MNGKARILVVEDDEALAQLLTYNLEAQGFEVKLERDGDGGELAILDSRPDLVVLDWMLPGVSGVELCRRVRANEGTRDLPVIMLTARGEERDRLRGLEAGADDYLAKPFSMQELTARIRAVLRRSRPSFSRDVLSHRDVEMDLASKRVRRGEREVRLSPTEFRLLRHFLEHPGRVFDRAQLLDRVWRDDAEVEPRTVDAAVRRLRKNLNAPGEVDLVRTVRAEGYALE